jgi:sugar-specific transcriptional regulator TrmB
LSLHEHGKQTLRELGLTSSQARIYVAILRLGGSQSVKAISNFSDIARQDVYRTIAELQQLGLVEKVIATPTRFQTTPLRDSLSILLQTRKQKTRTLQEEADRLVSHFPEKTEERIYGQERDRFLLVSERTALMHLIKKVVEATRKYILIITSWNDCAQWHSILPEAWSNAAKKGVNIRWLTEKTENANLQPEIMMAALQKPNFLLRVLPHQPNARFGICDGTGAFMAISSNPNAAESPALWTNNRVIISLMEYYFETMWKKSSKMQR